MIETSEDREVPEHPPAGKKVGGVIGAARTGSLFDRCCGGGRRGKIRRREDRRKWSYVDRYQQSLFGVIVIILFLSVIDAILTLVLINHGGPWRSIRSWRFTSGWAPIPSCWSSTP